MNMPQAQEFFDAIFERHAVMAILRGLDPEQTARLSRSAVGAGLAAVEVPLQSPQAEESLAAAVEALAGCHIPVGAGTVLSPATVDRAAALGARFTVAPGFSTEVMGRSIGLGPPHLPGVAIPSEIQTAVGLGIRWPGRPPASALGLELAMAGPFPGIRLVATGGLTADSAPRYLAAGAAAVSLGAGPPPRLESSCSPWKSTRTDRSVRDRRSVRGAGPPQW